MARDNSVTRQEPPGLVDPCPSWSWGVLGFEKPTRVPCGGAAGHEGRHRYVMEWDEAEPSEVWFVDRWLPAPLQYTRDNIDESCAICTERADVNGGAWPCHRCGHTYHMGPCGGRDSEDAMRAQGSGDHVGGSDD